MSHKFFFQCAWCAKTGKRCRNKIRHDTYYHSSPSYYCTRHCNRPLVHSNTFFSILPRDLTTYLLNFIHDRYTFGKYLGAIPKGTIDIHLQRLRIIDPLESLEFEELFRKLLFNNGNLLSSAQRYEITSIYRNNCGVHSQLILERLKTLVESTFKPFARSRYQVEILYKIESHLPKDDILTVIEETATLLTAAIDSIYPLPNNYFLFDTRKLISACRHILLTHLLMILKKNDKVHPAFILRKVDYKNLSSLFKKDKLVTFSIE